MSSIQLDDRGFIIACHSCGQKNRVPYSSPETRCGKCKTTLRPPAELIPRQRQCLASLLAQPAERPQVIYLAVAGDRCGTFRDQPTPAGHSVQNVWRSAA